MRSRKSVQHSSDAEGAPLRVHLYWQWVETSKQMRSTEFSVDQIILGSSRVIRPPIVDQRGTTENFEAESFASRSRHQVLGTAHRTQGQAPKDSKARATGPSEVHRKRSSSGRFLLNCRKRQRSSTRGEETRPDRVRGCVRLEKTCSSHSSRATKDFRPHASR